MSFQEFLERYNGRLIDFDGAWGFQCFDLLHQYIVEVLGLTDGRILAAPAAKDIFNNFDNLFGHEYFDEIANTPAGIPQEGDIVIFGNGQYGHVSIFIEGNASRFTSFDQNYPTGSPCHVQEHTYGYCLGWLRCKEPQEPQVSVPSKTFEELVRKSTITDRVAEILQVPISGDVIVEEVKKFIKFEDIIREKEAQLSEAGKETAKLGTQLKALKEQHTVLKDEKEKLDAQAEEMTKTIEVQGKEMTSLSGELQSLQEAIRSDNSNGWKLIIKGILKLMGKRR